MTAEAWSPRAVHLANLEMMKIVGTLVTVSTLTAKLTLPMLTTLMVLRSSKPCG